MICSGVGARAVTFNPHFPYFLSPDTSDSALGSGQPNLPCFCWISSCHSCGHQACVHTHAVWILLQDRPSHSATGIATDQRKAHQIGCSDSFKQLSAPLSLVLVRRKMGLSALQLCYRFGLFHYPITLVALMSTL